MSNKLPYNTRHYSLDETINVVTSEALAGLNLNYKFIQWAYLNCNQNQNNVNLPVMTLTLNPTIRVSNTANPEYHIYDIRYRMNGSSLK